MANALINPLALEGKILTVSELNAFIRDILESRFDLVWVEGEISNFRSPSSGHFYFTLKDEKSQIRAVVFRSQNRFLKFTPKDGLKIVARGKITLFEARGEYQIILDYIEPKGWGAMQLAFEELKEKLRKEGLFDTSRKKPLPLLPQKIGIITSPTGAAIRDILNIMEKRFANIEILIYPVKVQGEGASLEIVQGIKELNDHFPLDVIILARGGGSLEDLWPFNEEPVARAIVNSKIPIISAVGHEVDFTIADFAADLRTPTPSAAAQIVVKEKFALKQEISTLSHRIETKVLSELNRYKALFSSLKGRLTSPKKDMVELRLEIDDFIIRIDHRIEETLRLKKERLGTRINYLYSRNPRAILKENLNRFFQIKKNLYSSLLYRLQNLKQIKGEIDSKLRTCSPMAIMERGYSITRLIPSEVILKDSSQAKTGDKISVTLYIGEILGEIKRIK